MAIDSSATARRTVWLPSAWVRVNTHGWNALNHVAIPIVGACAIAIAWLARKRRLSAVRAADPA